MSEKQMFIKKINCEKIDPNLMASQIFYSIFANCSVKNITVYYG